MKIQVKWVLAVTVATWGFATSLSAQETGNPSPSSSTRFLQYNEGGMYWRGFLVKSSIGGDFNDTSVLGGDLAIDIPRVKDGFGPGLAVGGYGSGELFGGGMEISYARTTHDTTSSLLGPSEATFHMVDFALLGDIKLSYGFRPYIECGVGFSRLTVDGASTSGDASFQGYTFFYGLGARVFITPKWYLNAEMKYRATTFTNVEGYNIDGNLDASGQTYSIGAAYVF